MFYVLFTEQRNHDDCLDDTYAHVFDTETDARTFSERAAGVFDGYTYWCYPNRLVPCETVDDVFNVCSHCDDEPTWHTCTAP